MFPQRVALKVFRSAHVQSCTRLLPAVGSLAAAGLPQAHARFIATDIDGLKIAAQVRQEVQKGIDEMKKKTGKAPGLAVVLVGSRPDSQAYVRMKKKACKEAGVVPFDHDLPADVSQADLLKVVQSLNANPKVHGILIQLPLPSHINEETILNAVDLKKDVDGFHPLNIGKLAMKNRTPMFEPCTPKGCIELLTRSGVNIAGKNAVVLGRSNIVGIPVAMMLLERNATVTIVHSRTKDIPAIVKQADIVIAAIGQTEMVKGSWLKPGCVVIDVGINSKEDKSDKRGYRLVGDVDYEDCKKVAGMITPVPGGVGPMTIAMLLQNTLDGARTEMGLKK